MFASQPSLSQSSYQCCHQGAVKQSTQQQRTGSKQTSDHLSLYSEMTSSPAAKWTQSEHTYYGDANCNMVTTLDLAPEAVNSAILRLRKLSTDLSSRERRAQPIGSTNSSAGDNRDVECSTGPPATLRCPAVVENRLCCFTLSQQLPAGRVTPIMRTLESASETSTDVRKLTITAVLHTPIRKLKCGTAAGS